MTNKPMLSVERELLERILDSIGFGEREELKAILDNQTPSNEQVAGLVPAELVALLRADLRQEVESARLSLAAKSNQDPAGYEACGELFKTVMGAQNYAGSMPVYPLFKSAPIGIDIGSAFEEMRRTIRSREALIDDLRSKISEHQQIAKVLSEDPEKSAEQLFNRLNPGCKWWKMGDDLKNRYRAEQPAPVSDHPQCEECKGWGYHENHHEGGGTECGECGGSGKAPVEQFSGDTVVCRRYQLEQSPGQNFYHYDLEPVYGSVPVTVSELITLAESAPPAVVMPEPYGLAMFKMLSGFDSVTPEQFNLVWTACRKEVARLNGVKP